MKRDSFNGKAEEVFGNIMRSPEPLKYECSLNDMVGNFKSKLTPAITAVAKLMDKKRSTDGTCT